MSDLPWLDGYSGQTVDELLSLEGKYRLDSLVVAFHQALEQKSAREGGDALSIEERLIPAIEVLESEVNNGGFAQFFVNSSNEYVPMIVQALLRIGCPKTADIKQKAIDALHLPTLSVEAIETAMAKGESGEALDACDALYFKGEEDIADKLFAFIKVNKDAFSL
jgi:hypothetical protein